MHPADHGQAAADGKRHRSGLYLGGEEHGDGARVGRQRLRATVEAPGRDPCRSAARPDAADARLGCRGPGIYQPRLSRAHPGSTRPARDPDAAPRGARGLPRLDPHPPQQNRASLGQTQGMVRHRHPLREDRLLVHGHVLPESRTSLDLRLADPSLERGDARDDLDRFRSVRAALQKRFNRYPAHVPSASVRDVLNLGRPNAAEGPHAAPAQTPYAFICLGVTPCL